MAAHSSRLASLATAGRLGELGRRPGWLQPLRWLQREFKGMAVVMKDGVALMAPLVFQLLLVLGKPTVLEPMYSLHCQRTRSPEHDHCQITRLHAVAFSRQSHSFPRAALQQAQITTAIGPESSTLEQLFLVVSTAAKPGSTEQPRLTKWVISPQDVRHKQELVQRIHRFRDNNEQDRLDLLILPVHFWTVVALILAIPGGSLLLWAAMRFHPQTVLVAHL